MTDYVIPCETVVRLAAILEENDDPFFQTIRIDNGIAVTSDTRLMSVECVGGPVGIIHLLNDPALIEVCRKEAVWKSSLTITVVEELRFATAKTTYGYVHPGNCCLWSDAPTDFNRWRTIVASIGQPTTEFAGGMAWNAAQIGKLAATAPSGYVVFEENINVVGPLLIRDAYDPNWFGVFGGWLRDLPTTPAVLPEWFKA